MRNALSDVLAKSRLFLFSYLHSAGISRGLTR
jgi:hypothetical protein